MNLSFLFHYPYHINYICNYRAQVLQANLFDYIKPDHNLWPKDFIIQTAITEVKNRI
jgi:hypothetical protein